MFYFPVKGTVNYTKNAETVSAHAGTCFGLFVELKRTEYKTEEQYEQFGNERKVSVSCVD